MRKMKRIGLVGVGGIMNGAHIPAYQKCEDCVITAICDVNPVALKNTGDKLNIPENLRFSDYHDLLSCGQIDAVDIATPPDVHVKIALDALNAGFPVSVEKPIGMNFGESVALANKSNETGLPVFVCLSWRYMTFPRYMKRLVDDGAIGRLYHIYIKYLKDSGLWKGRKLEWRFEAERASSGVLSDLGSHMFDFIRFLGEDYDSIYCSRGISVKRRQTLDGSEWKDVTTDDWSNVICKLKSGIDATISLSRTATNDVALFECYAIGEKGSIRFSCDYNLGGAAYQLEGCFGESVKKNEFKPIEIPADFEQGNQSRAFLDLIDGIENEYTATIFRGLASQAAVDAATLSSNERREITFEELYSTYGMKYETEQKSIKEFDINIENMKLEKGE